MRDSLAWRVSTGHVDIPGSHHVATQAVREGDGSADEGGEGRALSETDVAGLRHRHHLHLARGWRGREDCLQAGGGRRTDR